MYSKLRDEAFISAGKEKEGNLTNEELTGFIMMAASSGYDGRAILSAIAELDSIASSAGDRDTLERAYEGQAVDADWKRLLPYADAVNKELSSIISDGIFRDEGLGLGVSEDPDNSNDEPPKEEEQSQEESPASLNQDARENVSRDFEKTASLISELALHIAIGEEDAILELIFRALAEEAGAEYPALRELTGELISNAKDAGFSDDDFREGNEDLVAYIKDQYLSRRWDDAFVKGDEMDGYKELLSASSMLGSDEGQTYFLTDGDIEDMIATGRTKENGERELRLVTDYSVFDERHAFSDGGIMSERLFGPLSGSACQCGACRSESAAESREGTACPKCGSAILSRKSRSELFAAAYSEAPLLFGRENIIAAMLGPDNIPNINILYSMERGEHRYATEVTINAEHNWSFRIIKVPDGGFKSPEDGKTHAYFYGSEGIEKALEVLGTEQIAIIAKEDGKTVKKLVPKAFMNAFRLLSEATERGEKPLGEKERESNRNIFLGNPTLAQNVFLAVRSMIMRRGGRSVDFLLHYLPITPPGTRPINDINGSSDMGARNEAYMNILKPIIMRNSLKEKGIDSQKEILRLDGMIASGFDEYRKYARDQITSKTGLVKGRMLSTRSDKVVRAVIVPDAETEGTAMLREAGVKDITERDVVGIPRHGARKMYEDEIRAKLRKEYGLSPIEIQQELNKRAGTMEIDENGNMRRCLADRTLDEIIINGGRGQLVLYTRQPTISAGSIQAGYVYLTDDDAIHIHPLITDAIAGDFDGDTMLAIKIMTKTAREEAKRLMRRNIVLDGSYKSLITPKLISLYGLNRLTAGLEFGISPSKIIMDDQKRAKDAGLIDENGFTEVPVSVLFHHIIPESIGAELTLEEGKTYKAGTVYGRDKDGKELRAPESMKIIERGGNIYAVTDYTDSVMVPAGRKVSEGVVDEGKAMFSSAIPESFESTEYVIELLRDKRIPYNMPIYMNGALTSPGREWVRSVLPEWAEIPENGFSKKTLGAVLECIIEKYGGDKAARDLMTQVAVDLENIGAEAVNLFGTGVSYQDFPTVAPVDMTRLYGRESERNAERRLLDSERSLMSKHGKRAPDDIREYLIRQYGEDGYKKRIKEETEAEAYREYEKIAGENADLMGKAIEKKKDSVIGTVISAGIKSRNFLAAMVDTPTTTDYNDSPMAALGGSLVYGTYGIRQSLQAEIAAKNNNKTIGVDTLGSERNRDSSRMDGALYEEGDCGSTESLEVDIRESSPLVDEIIGRTAAEDVSAKNGSVIIKKGEYFTRDKLLRAMHDNDGRVAVRHRSALTCRCEGVCSACAGDNRLMQLKDGENIGILAVSALYAPLSQETMNRAKLGGQVENGMEKIKRIKRGTGIATEGVSAKMAAQMESDLILSEIPGFNPLFAEVYAKHCVMSVGRDHLMKPLWEGKSTDQGRVIRETALLRLSESSVAGMRDAFEIFGSGNGRAVRISDAESRKKAKEARENLRG